MGDASPSSPVVTKNEQLPSIYIAQGNLSAQQEHSTEKMNHTLLGKTGEHST